MYVRRAVRGWGGSQGSIGTPDTGVTNGGEGPCECQELKMGPLQEQEVSLTIELPLQPPVGVLKAQLNRSTPLYHECL